MDMQINRGDIWPLPGRNWYLEASRCKALRQREKMWRITRRGGAYTSCPRRAVHSFQLRLNKIHNFGKRRRTRPADSVRSLPYCHLGSSQSRRAAFAEFEQFHRSGLVWSCQVHHPYRESLCSARLEEIGYPIHASSLDRSEDCSS